MTDPTKPAGLGDPAVAAAVAALIAAQAAPGQPGTLFRAADDAYRAVVGHRLFTVMALRAETAEAERIYTNDPVAYPVTGRKPMHEDRWSAQVIGRREVFLGRTLAEIAEVFPDYELIGSLGCGAVLNFPIVYDDRVLGTINVLDAEGCYDEAAIDRGRWLAPFLAPALLSD
ncbi:MAG TPA: GAF domain-containing protein [Inquilinus sp.]|nr:GAF domain-containing protein [Inquilinus sp.]